MVRLLIGAAVIISLIGVVLFYNVYIKSPSPNPSGQIATSTSSASLADRVDSLEEAVTLLDKKVSQISGTPQVLPSQAPGLSSTSDLSSRISILETEVADLKSGNNNQSSSSSQGASTKSNPVYIPLGSSDPQNSTNWTNLDSVSANINPANYPGYTSMQLEISLRLNSGGTAYAQLANGSNNVEVSNSLVSTTSTTFVLLDSSGFTLPSGNNLYKVQVKDTSGDTMFIQNARIKVNF